MYKNIKFLSSLFTFAGKANFFLALVLLFVSTENFAWIYSICNLTGNFILFVLQVSLTVFFVCIVFTDCQKMIASLQRASKKWPHFENPIVNTTKTNKKVPSFRHIWIVTGMHKLNSVKSLLYNLRAIKSPQTNDDVFAFLM